MRISREECRSSTPWLPEILRAAAEPHLGSSPTGHAGRSTLRMQTSARYRVNRALLRTARGLRSQSLQPEEQVYQLGDQSAPTRNAHRSDRESVAHQLGRRARNLKSLCINLECETSHTERRWWTPARNPLLRGGAQATSGPGLARSRGRAGPIGEVSCTEPEGVFPIFAVRERRGEAVLARLGQNGGNL